jgi:hypothetical protein
MQTVFVAKRQMIEQILDGLDAAFVQPGGDALTDTLEVLDGRAKFEGHGLDASRADRRIFRACPMK